MARHDRDFAPRPKPAHAHKYTITDRIFYVLTPERMRLLSILATMLAFVFLCLSTLYIIREQNAVNKERNDRRAQINSQIHEVACALVAPYPDTIPYVRNFRSKYDCPPYDPKIAKQLQPGATPTASPSASPSHRAAPTTPAASTLPQPTQPIGILTVTGAPTTSTRTVTVPHTTTATRTRTATPSASRPPGILPIPGCTVTVLGIPLC